MSTPRLVASPLTAAAFAPFGQVIERNPAVRRDMNDGRFDRYDNLAIVDTAGQGGFTNVGVVSCRVASALPYEITLLERHPLGSQAFVPLSAAAYVVVTAPPGAQVDGAALRAFVARGGQGVNFARGVWHLPLLGFEPGQSFLVIDRGGTGPNCETFRLPQPVILEAELDGR